MKILYILVTTLLILKGNESLEDPSKTQWILLRKLQSYTESKPVTWNEMLANILVKKIIPVDEEKDAVTKEGTVVEQKGFFTGILSDAFAVFKKFIYDPYIRRYKYEIVTPTTNTTYEKYPEGKVKTRHVPLPDGPKGEVEIIEPRYHGKLSDGTEKTEQEDSAVLCPEGTVLFEGVCSNSSKLMISVPRQCPVGYRRDRLGWCRMMF